MNRVVEKDIFMVDFIRIVVQVVSMRCTGLECGARPAASPGPGAGLPAQHGDWPWHVSLHREGRHVCDGTLVHTKWVVSTKSCFQGSVL